VLHTDRMLISAGNHGLEIYHSEYKYDSEKPEEKGVEDYEKNSDFSSRKRQSRYYF
jgi:hypothetical protein